MNLHNFDNPRRLTPTIKNDFTVHFLQWYMYMEIKTIQKPVGAWKKNIFYPFVQVAAAR